MFLLRAVLNLTVRNASPRGHMCFRCLIFSLSGPCELKFLHCFSVLDTVVISGEDVCCSVVFGTMVGVFVFSIMWSELLMTSAICCPLWSSVYECHKV